MPEQVSQSLHRSLGLYRDLIEGIPADALNRKLPELRSNTIGQQLWCVIGARESYGRAIEEGEWKGFACSLEDTQSQSEVATHLEESATRVRALLAGGDDFTDAQDEFALDLLEHEAQHQGQLIRYLYALDLEIPPSWKQRWALD